MRVVIIDNYDSFTYNLAQHIHELTGSAPDVIRNDAIAPEELVAWDRIVISPGPGVPKDAGICIPLIQKLAGKVPILGICLGLQSIAEAFGGSLINLRNVFHGVATEIQVTDSSNVLFAGLEQRFPAGRYHSWVADVDTLPEVLKITATDDKGQVMALRHVHLPVFGVQFHPESILTPNGKEIIKNFLFYTDDSKMS